MGESSRASVGREPRLSQCERGVTLLRDESVGVD